MVTAALAARVVEVITDLGAAAGSRYRYGSGCIVHGKTVLTAAHVVTGAVSVVVRDPAKREYSATLDPRFVGDATGSQPDLALLEIGDPAFGNDLPPIGLAAVDRESVTGEPVERCHAIGYPWFAETRSRIAVRDTVDAIGVIPVLSKLAAGLLSVQVTVAPRPLPPQEITLGASEWSGMSGAPVVANGYLVGVVIEQAPREGRSTVTAVPLTALQANLAHEEWGPGVTDPAAWWSRLGVGGIGDLELLPAPLPPQPEPEYRATLREFGRALHRRMPQLLDRQQELDQIADFATSAEGYRWLVAGAFTGKTALLYEAVTVGLPDTVDVVCYFLSRPSSDASGHRFLEAVVPQLAYLCDVDPPVATVDKYRALWEQAVTRAAQTGRHLLLVVDGLDEDLLPPGSPSVASLLPTLTGAYAHVLVATRPRNVNDQVTLGPFKGAPELAELAEQEIRDLTHGGEADLAVGVLGVLTAAAGPLSLSDLVTLRSDRQGTPTAADTRHLRRLVEDRAARSLERVGPAGKERYRFAHPSLLAYAQADNDLNDAEYRQRIHRWAADWRSADWPPVADGGTGTPPYLLDTYPSTLARDPQRLAELTGDVGWIEAAVQFVGVNRVLADLRQAAEANPASEPVAAMLATVSGQDYCLRPPRPVNRPGYVLQQLCMQAGELSEDHLADDLRGRLQARPGPWLAPMWTTRRASRARVAELGRHAWVQAIVVLPDGRVVTGGIDGSVLVWNPATPGADPVTLGHHDNTVAAMAVLPDGRVVTGGSQRVMLWDPTRPSATPAELGRHAYAVTAVAVLPDGRVAASGGTSRYRVLVWDPADPRALESLGSYDSDVAAMAVLPDGRVVTGGQDGRVLVWDPATPFAGPAAELGRHDSPVGVVAVLPDGRLVTGGDDGRVLVWDPATPGTRPAELGRREDGVWAAAALANGRVVTGGGDGRVLVWDPATPGAAPAELGRHDKPVRAVAVLPDGRLVTGGDDGRVLVWDPAGPGTDPAEPGWPDAWIRAVAVLPGGRVVSCGNDGRVLVWDPARPGTAPAELGRHDSWGWTEAVLPDGRVVTGGGDGRVLVRDPATPGADPVELGRHESAVRAVAVLPDGRVVTGGGDGRVLVRDPATPGADPVELGRHDSTVNAVAVLSGGPVVTGAYDGRVLVWDPATPGANPVDLGRHYGEVLAVAALPDGRVVTGGYDGRVLVWDPATPGADPVELGHHHRHVVTVAVLPGGQVVTGGTDRRVLVRDPAQDGAIVVQLDCSVVTLAAAPLGPATSCLVIAHEGKGLSTWSAMM